MARLSASVLSVSARGCAAGVEANAVAIAAAMFGAPAVCTVRAVADAAVTDWLTIGGTRCTVVRAFATPGCGTFCELVGSR